MFAIIYIETILDRIRYFIWVRNDIFAVTNEDA